MLFPALLKYFWRSRRLTILSYCALALAYVAVMYFYNQKASSDFNALILLGSLNMAFWLYGPFLAQRLVYQNYRQSAHYFFAALPIAPLRLRCYELLSFFLAGLLPYVLALPVLLLSVYSGGLWSNSQVVNFLVFQSFFWLVFASYALALAMSGRICWHLFLIVLMGCLLYGFYTKNFNADYLSFIAVHKVLYKTDALTVPAMVKYGLLTLFFLGTALALSFSVNRRGFLWLHAKETPLARGLSLLMLLVGLAGNIYIIGKFSATESTFSGLHLRELSQHPEVFFSSSVPLTEQTQPKFAVQAYSLSLDLQAFADNYQLTLPKLHFQHNPDAKRVKPLTKYEHADDHLELELNFDELGSRFADSERDVLVELLTYLSKGWLSKEHEFIFLRGLAANWSWRGLDQDLLRRRQAALTESPELNRLALDKQWLSLYQDAGPCLFDAYAGAMVAKVNNQAAKPEVVNYLRTRLNLDGLWLPLHVWRSWLSFSSAIDSGAALALPVSVNMPTDKNQSQGRDVLPFFILTQKQIFPQVMQPSVRISRLTVNHAEARIEFYQHDSPGRQINYQKIQSEALPKGDQVNLTPKFILVKKERFSATLSWYRRDLDCRVNLPWQHKAL